jgi:putative tryptophan/tyrosine transport system substrate-binding protein
VRRREVIAGLAGATAGWPRAVSAQQPAMPVVGFLSSESPALFASFLGAFTHGLKEAGFVEGQNVAIEYRWAQGQNERLPILAADLVQRQVSVIAAPGSTPAALAAQRASATIPIVIFTGGDPVALGLVASLNRPGGNVTGATSLGRELAAKRLGLLHELMPTATIMALLVNPTNTALTETTTSDVQAAARTLGLQLHILHAGTERDFEKAFATLVQLRASALVIAIDSFFTVRREKLAALALRHGVPAVYQYRDFAAAGGVMSYGGSLVEGYHLVGLYTGRILRGEKPADLPVQQVTKVELVINLIAANALNLTIPPSLLARADEVIE